MRKGFTGYMRAGDYRDAEKVSRGTSQDFTGCVSLAVQSQRDEVDINTIVRRFGVTGHMPQGVVAPTYQAFEGVFDFQTAMNAVVFAEQQFMQMPADVRARFRNDPQRFVEFVSDSKNLSEMRDLGLAIPEKVVDTTPTPDIPPVKEKANDKSSSSSRAAKGGSPSKGSSRDSGELEDGS